ncbi:MAG: ECF-type sigma factor [Bryobacteraceae bacterium]
MTLENFMPAMQNRQAVDYLFSVTYEELRRLASAVRRDDPSATLTPTVLVHEAWIKLAGSKGFEGMPPVEFKRIAAYAMRQLLVEAARRRMARKRGGGQTFFVTLDESMDSPVGCDAELIALDAALERLQNLKPRQAQVVALRFFGGLQVSEVAESIGVSEETVHRDWKSARALLAREVRRNSK